MAPKGKRTKKSPPAKDKADTLNAVSPNSLPTAPTETNTYDESQLMDDLIASMHSRDQTVQAELTTGPNVPQPDQQAESLQSTHKQDAKSRFKARQARRAAAQAQTYTSVDPEVDAQLQREIDAEESTLNSLANKMDMEIHQIEPDGHCLFSAVADQLQRLHILKASQANYQTTRLAAASYMGTHPDDFLPFLPSDGEGLMSPLQFEKYCLSIRDTAIWGGEPEILALSRAYGIRIHVLQSGTPHVVVHDVAGSLEDEPSGPVAWITYHRKMYALGEHYNSLKSKTIS